MALDDSLTPASQLAATNPIRQPHESDTYRAARTALLAEEIELRRHIERVAAQRRQLPTGPEVRGDYRFEGKAGETDFAGLFGTKDTLVLYSFMFGAAREKPCPMCTTLLDSWDGEVGPITDQVALAVVARSPYARLAAYAKERGWRGLPLYADLTDAFSRDYHAIMPDGDDTAAFSVFTRRDGTIRLFWSAEMGFETADPGQDPRDAPDLMPIWTILDATPEGRKPDWYPTLAMRV
ncbi:DUF899 family protein [Sphingomonas naphthae]|uniref:DUF899 family protein n=1 Tax=Sphingomonas naphthae TaxID=1813468 RepID=A0ABY7TNU0_9SPHN|nr:DUF899 family protein [Sphingomonas naphthae]WCT74065.1 DUF899 family protein [Sphingomonas naphthae]